MFLQLFLLRAHYASLSQTTFNLQKWECVFNGKRSGVGCVRIRFGRGAELRPRTKSWQIERPSTCPDKKTLRVSHYDKGAVIQEYIEGLHHGAPGAEQQDLKTNRQLEEKLLPSEKKVLIAQAAFLGSSEETFT
ncbi:hypothetical protein NQZ68_007621 [Dissostichus eleginoides]|nr:hypothetical protein NQZ68_007621 [Dissostichus eleginoides]